MKLLIFFTMVCFLSIVGMFFVGIFPVDIAHKVFNILSAVAILSLFGMLLNTFFR